MTGIYIVKNLRTGDTYIGASRDLQKRKYQHLYCLSAGVHSSKKLQSAFTPFDDAEFGFEVLEEVDPTIGDRELGDLEISWFGKIRPTANVKRNGRSYSSSEIGALDHERRRLRRKQIYDELQAGFSPEEISERYGIGVASIKIVGSMGIASFAPHPGRNARISRRKEIADAVAAGENPLDVANRFNYSLASVYQFCHIHGVPTPKAGGMRESVSIVTPAQWASADWEKRDVDLAKHFGVTRERVRQMRRKLHKPNGTDFRVHAAFLRFRDWVDRNGNREKIAGLLPTDVSAMFGETLSRQSIARWCERLGVRLAKTKRMVDVITRESLPELVRRVHRRADLSECWEWIGQQNMRPRIVTDDGPELISRYVYRLFHGPLVNGDMVLLRCRNVNCVNPDHLVKGDKHDARQFSGGPPKRMTAAQREEALRLVARGESYSKIGAKLGFGVMSIYGLVKRVKQNNK